MEENKKGHFSFSSLNRFDKCEYDGYLHFIGDGENKKTTALRAGSLFHKCIELHCNKEEIDNWILNEPDADSYTKKNGDYYAEYALAIDSAFYLWESELYHGLNVIADPYKYKDEEDENNIELLEYELNETIGKVPMKGYIDFLETDKDNVKIHDWKFIKDYKKVYNESSRRYEEWYEKYIDQQMIYAYMLYMNSKAAVENHKITCEIVGITKMDVPAIRQIQFSFDSIDAMTETVRWKLLTARLRYAWKKLNETTEDNVDELKHCGECESCRSHNIVVREVLEIE